MGIPKGKILAIDRVSQNRLNTIKKYEIWIKSVLDPIGVTPKGLQSQNQPIFTKFVENLKEITTFFS